MKNWRIMTLMNTLVVLYKIAPLAMYRTISFGDGNWLAIETNLEDGLNSLTNEQLETLTKWQFKTGVDFVDETGYIEPEYWDFSLSDFDLFVRIR